MAALDAQGSAGWRKIWESELEVVGADALARCFPGHIIRIAFWQRLSMAA